MHFEVFQVMLTLLIGYHTLRTTGLRPWESGSGSVLQDFEHSALGPISLLALMVSKH